MSERYWQQFMQSGRIEDYLNYAKMRDIENKQGDADGYAGAHLFDGNDIETDLRGGVRQAYYPFDQGEG